jgi:hypothetical protein
MKMGVGLSTGEIHDQLQHVHTRFVGCWSGACRWVASPAAPVPGRPTNSPSVQCRMLSARLVCYGYYGNCQLDHIHYVGGKMNPACVYQMLNIKCKIGVSIYSNGGVCLLGVAIILIGEYLQHIGHCIECSLDTCL